MHVLVPEGTVEIKCRSPSCPAVWDVIADKTGSRHVYFVSEDHTVQGDADYYVGGFITNYNNTAAACSSAQFNRVSYFPGSFTCISSYVPSIAQYPGIVNQKKLYDTIYYDFVSVFLVPNLFCSTIIDCFSPTEEGPMGPTLWRQLTVTSVLPCFEWRLMRVSVDSLFLFQFFVAFLS